MTLVWELIVAAELDPWFFLRRGPEHRQIMANARLSSRVYNGKYFEAPVHYLGWRESTLGGLAERSSSSFLRSHARGRFARVESRRQATSYLRGMLSETDASVGYHAS